MPAKSTNRFDYEKSANPLGVMPKDYPENYEVGSHRHDRGQLIYAISGLMRVFTDSAEWFVPPQHALWMPPGLDHNMRALQRVTLRTLYVRRDMLPAGFLSRPIVIRVTPLLRELLSRAAEVPIDYAEDSQDARIMAALFGEAELASHAFDFSLARAKDRRLARVCDAIIADPACADGIEDRARSVSTSGRTLARLFKSELGVTYVAWRQQVRIMLSLPRLSSGEQITSIATDLGYETPGSFAQMFRRLMGVAPSAYFKERASSGDR